MSGAELLPVGRASGQGSVRTAEPASRFAPAAGTITPRALLLGLGAMAVNVWWVTQLEVRWGIMDGSCLPLFVTPVFILFALTVLNLPCRRLFPRLALTQAELLAIYIATVISETLAGHDFVQNLFGAIGHAHWFATPENRWGELFQEYLPGWLVVSDPTALKWFYQGGAHLGMAEATRPFLVPLAAWGAMLLGLIGVMLALNLLVREHWTENEKLAYPLILLPVEMTAGRMREAFFVQGAMWLGFGLAALVDIINGLHVLYPTVPAIAGVKLTVPTLTTPPWNAMFRFYLGVYPFAIALAFFLPKDLSFSCWFFFLLSQAQMIVSGMLGLRDAPPDGFPYLAPQASGAWLALAIGALLGTRRHLARVWQRLREPREGAEASEAHIYRLAVGGAALGLVFLGGFFSLAGMGPGLVAAFLVIFFLLSLAMTRVRAEFGAPHEIFYVNPQRILVDTVGVGSLGAGPLTALSATYWFNRCYRCHPMPFQLESLKMAETTGMSYAAVARTILVATVLAILLSFLANLQITLQAGAAAKAAGFKSWVGWQTYNRLGDWLAHLPGRNYPALGGMLAGAAIFFALRYLHFNTMLPLHPAGYALSVSFAVNYFWFSFLIGWLIKTAVLRYGGRDGHRFATKFFLGLLLGDYVLGSVWGIIGPVWGVRTYKIFV